MGITELLLFVVSYAIGFMAIAFAVATGVYLGNKWVKKGKMPGILSLLESNKKG